MKIKVILISIPAVIGCLTAGLYVYGLYGYSGMNLGFSVNDNSILKPEFEVGSKVYKAGTTFKLKFEDRYFLVTAHHLFGPAGSLEVQLSPSQLSDQFQSIKGYDFDSGEVLLTSNSLVRLDQAAPYREGDPSKDLSIFELSADTDGYLELSKEKPSKGDTVYLFARLKKHKEGDPLLHPATVIESTDTTLDYRYKNGFLNPRATSGAPILNSDGKVVGMNIAAAGIPIFNWKGRANPLDSIFSQLSAHVSKTKDQKLVEI